MTTITLPAVRIDALETFVELLARVEADGSSDAFYSSLCEAVCRLTSMDRAVIFRYDEAQPPRARGRRLRPRRSTASRGAHVTVESAPIARQALEEDRVIDMDAEAVAREVPEAFRDLLRRRDARLRPLAAGGRWSGVILADRAAAPRRSPTTSATCCGRSARSPRWPRRARHATFQQARARQLQERIDLAREVHEGVIQRLFGVLAGVLERRELPAEARERIGVELQAALRDLRRALQRPLGRSAPRDETTLLAEVERLRRAHPELGIALAPAAPTSACRASSSRSRSRCSSRRSATRASTPQPRASRSRCARRTAPG